MIYLLERRANEHDGAHLDRSAVIRYSSSNRVSLEGLILKAERRGWKERVEIPCFIRANTLCPEPLSPRASHLTPPLAPPTSYLDSKQQGAPRLDRMFHAMRWLSPGVGSKVATRAEGAQARRSELRTLELNRFHLQTGRGLSFSLAGDSVRDAHGRLKWKLLLNLRKGNVKVWASGDGCAIIPRWDCLRSARAGLAWGRAVAHLNRSVPPVRLLHPVFIFSAIVVPSILHRLQTHVVCELALAVRPIAGHFVPHAGSFCAPCGGRLVALISWVHLPIGQEGGKITARKGHFLEVGLEGVLL
jgi:hypothetical protein